jgi:hypothetical protein
MTCNGEGTRSSERIAMRPLFGPSGEGVGLTYLDRGNEEVTVFRCLEPTAAAAK